MIFKDEELDIISEKANVAQFVSFSPELEMRYSHLKTHTPNHRFVSVEDAASAVLGSSNARSVNIRSFSPEQNRGNPFIRNLTTVDEIARNVQQIADSGLYSIVFETIPIDDGGIPGGIMMNRVIEFSTTDCPRILENSPEQVATLPAGMAIEMIKTVYGISPALTGYENKRVEFSIHPKRLGHRHDHTIIWEVADTDDICIQPRYVWPNDFSMMIGDKAYGLLIAQLFGFRVPRTTVVIRSGLIHDFSFGRETNSSIRWVRTCPTVQQPGKYSTVRGMCDPHMLMVSDDPDNESVVSCLVQHEVTAVYSGATITGSTGPIIEGVAGTGDQFMQGKAAPNPLPNNAVRAVLDVFRRLRPTLGPVRFEWVYDGTNVWIVQLHVGSTLSGGQIIYPGDFSHPVIFDVAYGLSELRHLIKNLGDDDSVIVVGNVGLTSHVADVLRKAKIPSRLY